MHTDCWGWVRCVSFMRCLASGRSGHSRKLDWAVEMYELASVKLIKCRPQASAVFLISESLNQITVTVLRALVIITSFTATNYVTTTKQLNNINLIQIINFLFISFLFWYSLKVFKVYMEFYYEHRTPLPPLPLHISLGPYGPVTRSCLVFRLSLLLYL